MREHDPSLQSVLQHQADKLQAELPAAVIRTTRIDKFSNERLGKSLEQIVNSFSHTLWTEEDRAQLQSNITDFLSTAMKYKNITPFTIGVDITNKDRQSILENNKVWRADDERVKHVLSFRPNPNLPWHFLVIYDDR